MSRLADRLIDALAARGRCSSSATIPQLFTLLVIADLLGVPKSEHGAFRHLLASLSYGPIGGDNISNSPVDALADLFTDYVEARRRAPGDDVLSLLATSKFADGSTPQLRRAFVQAGLLSGVRRTGHHRPPWPAPCASSPRMPGCSSACAASGSHPGFHRRDPAAGGAHQGRFPHGAADDGDRGRADTGRPTSCSCSRGQP